MPGVSVDVLLKYSKRWHRMGMIIKKDVHEDVREYLGEDLGEEHTRED